MRGDKRPLPAPLSAELVQPEKVDAKLNTSIHNRFDVEVIDSRTGEVRQRAQGENVICNQMWDMMLNNYNTVWNKFIHYGSGSGTPSANDVSLFSYVGGIRSTEEKITRNSLSGEFSCKRKITLSPEISVGVSITEVGIGYENAASTLCTHAMLMDMNGSRICILKSNTDIINIYSTVFVHVNMDGYGGGVGGGVHDWMFGIAQPPKYAYGTYAGKFNSIKKAAAFTFDILNKKAVVKVARFEVSDSRLKAFSAIVIDNLLSCRADQDTALQWYSPARIAGDTLGTGDGSTVDFATTFYSIKDVKVYLDGVQTNNFTITKMSPDTKPLNEQIFSYLAYEINGKGKPFGGFSCSDFIRKDEVKIYYNPYYEYGVKEVSIVSGTLETSDDLVNWKIIESRTSSSYINKIIPPEYYFYKYWKFTGIDITTSNNWFSGGTPVKAIPLTNIHLSAPPAQGVVVSADYTPKCIAKDANHVFDFSCELQFGEYTPPVV